MNNSLARFEDIQRQVTTLYRMKLRNSKDEPVPAGEIKDMIENVFIEQNLDIQNNEVFRDWHCKILKEFRLKPRKLNRKKRRKKCPIAAYKAA